MRSGHWIGLTASAAALASAVQAVETVTYKYDALGRLTVTTNGNGTIAAVSYDPVGNRTGYSVSGISGINSPTVAGGGFENPDAGASYLYRPTANFTHNSGVAGNGSAWGFAAAPEGDQVAFIQTIDAPAVISLPVSGLAAGSSYVVRFQIALRPGFAANPITVAFNGVSLGTFTPGSTVFTAVNSAAFTAGGSTGTLTFTGAAYAGDTSTGLDNVTVALASAPAPTVSGGGFESPDVGASYAYRPTGGPAAYTRNSGIAGNGSAWGFASAPEGDQVAFIQTIDAPAVISLPVSGLVAGTSYAVTFRLAARPGFLSNPITVAFNGASLGTFTPASTAFASATSGAFTPSGSSGTLTFTGANYAGDTSTGLDDVRVAVAGTTPVPPPSDPPPPPSGNRPPVAVNDSGETMRCTSVSVFEPLANDHDPDGDSSLLQVIDAAYSGSLGTAMAARTMLRFFPNNSGTGTAVVTYTVRDAGGATATATVTINVIQGQCS
jgi:YD repeat-containing protein